MSTHPQQKTALVFGGARGIGAAIVRRLAQDGYAVGFTYVSRPDQAEALIRELSPSTGTVFAIDADSARPADLQAAVAAAVERFGRLDAVVVNAGVLKTGVVGEVSLEDLDLSIDVNFRGVFLAIQACVPHLKDGGRVVTIGSNTAVRTGSPGASVYQATKAAVAGLVKGLALDLAPRGITVNNVQPGPIQTDMHTAAIVEALATALPVKRIGQPAEVAGLVAWMVGAEAGYMTGASVTIDGGYVL